MNDNNLAIEQPSRPCSNQNSLHENEKVDLCEDDKNVKRFKSDDGQAHSQELLRQGMFP